MKPQSCIVVQIRWHTTVHVQFSQCRWLSTVLPSCILHKVHTSVSVSVVLPVCARHQLWRRYQWDQNMCVCYVAYHAISTTLSQL